MPLLGSLVRNALVGDGLSALFPPGPIVPGWLVLDDLGLLVGAVVVGLTVLLILSSPATNQVFHHVTLSLFFVPVALAVVTAANVVVFYVAWELAALFAWALGRLSDESVEEGATPFSAAGALASLLMLAGLGLLFVRSRTASLADLKLADAEAASLLVLGAIFLKAFGLLSESWQRHTAARFSLANATLAGTSLLVIGFLPVFRFFGGSVVRGAPWIGLAALLAGALALAAAGAALGADDVRKVGSYGAYSQFSALVFALLTGLPGAALGATYGAVTYSLAITGLLLCVGQVEVATGERSLQRLGGVAQRLPATALLFLLSAIALAGLPPFGGAVASALIGQDLWQQPDSTRALLWLGFGFLTALYLARLFGRIFLGELRVPVKVETSFLTFAAVGLLLAGLMLAGLASEQVMALVRPAWMALSA